MTLRRLPSTTWAPMSGSMILLLTLMLSVLSVPALARNRTGNKSAYALLHKFTGGEDGGNPAASLILDRDGNLYGTASSGGAFNWGVVFKFDSSGKETVLHSFAGGDGLWPEGPLVIDRAGNLYGTTWDGGTPEGGGCYFGCGTVFKIDTAGKYSVMYAFTGGADGGNPASSLVLDRADNLYGTTTYGGSGHCFEGCGVVFKVDKRGKETVLYNFGASGGLVRDKDGSLYGATESGGTAGYGTVFKLDSTGAETVLYNFTGGTDGGWPIGTLVRDQAGNLYGATTIGGDLFSCEVGEDKGCGVVFKVDSSGNETVLYDFSQLQQGTPGGLLRDQAGNLYGVAGNFGRFGILFKLSPNGKLHVLHNFQPRSGDVPEAGVITDSAGNLYGTTQSGGMSACSRNLGCGVVYKWTP